MGDIDVAFWYWWVAGLALLILEMLVPGAFFLWSAVSAFVVGGVLMLFPNMEWETQLLVFSVLSIVSVFIWRRWFLSASEKSENPTLNHRGAQYIDRIFVLESPLENGVGRIKVDDTIWRVMGEDCPGATRVKVTGADGVMLKVECLPD